MCPKYNPNIHHRRSIRLKDYDYSQDGYYFVTICTKNRECIFGNIIAGKMRLSEIGKIILDEWFQSSKIRQEIQLDLFIVMPNHVHAIVGIINVGATGRLLHKTFGPSKQSLGSFIAGFKSITTKRINILRNTPCMPVWQRNYYEHIIRNENELKTIREYITNNPLKWELDQNNPKTVQYKKQCKTH